MILWEKNDGSQIAETAITIPIVLLLLLGVLITGRGLNIESTVQYAAQQGAISASRRTGTLSGNQYFPDQAAEAVTRAIIHDNLDPRQVQSVQRQACACGNAACSRPVPCDPLSTGEPQVCIQSGIELNPGKTELSVCGVSVSFRYPYQFLGTQIFLNATSEAIEEQ